MNGFGFSLVAPHHYERADQQGNSVTGSSNLRTSIATDIDIREGQKVVVGKTSMDGSDNHLILVVTAEVVD
jgi:hypothetical protein